MSLTIPGYIEVKTAAGATAAYLSPEADGLKEVWLDTQLNGHNTLTLALPLGSEKWQYLTDAHRIIAGGREFVIVKPDAIDVSRDGQKLWGKVMAEESWVLLGKRYVTASNDPTNPNPSWSVVSIISGGSTKGGYAAGSAGNALAWLLEGSGWSIATVDVAGTHDLETEKENLLANIQKVQEVWGGYLVWDSPNKTVSLRSESAWQNYTGFQIRYAKNLKSITRTVDFDLVTKLYPFGEDDLNIYNVNVLNSGTAQSGGVNTITLAASALTVNQCYTGATVILTGGTGSGQSKKITAYNGSTKSATVDSNWTTAPDATTTYEIKAMFLLNFQYTNEIFEDKYENQELATAQELKDKAVEVLDKLSKPRYNYRVQMVDLRTLPEYSHEDFVLGDMADVIDEGLGVNVRARIIRHKYDVFQPWKCDLDVGDPIESLAAMLAGTKSAAEFVKEALKPNPGVGNMLKGFVNTFATTINSANGKLVWDDSMLQAIEIDAGGAETGKRVRITPGGIGISTDGGQTYVTAMTGAGILANTIVCNALYALATEDGYTKLTGRGLEVWDKPGVAGDTVRLINSGSTEGYYSSPKFQLSPSTKYTISLKVRGTVGVGKFDVFVLSSTGTFIQCNGNVFPGGSWSPTEVFQVIYKPFTTTSDISGTEQYIRLDHDGDDAGYIDIAEVKLIQEGCTDVVNTWSDGWVVWGNAGMAANIQDTSKKRLHAGQYQSGKFGLEVRDKTGNVVILDEDGILQTWQEGRADNVDGSNPLALNVYLPAETKSIKKVLLRFRLQAFRAYETGAASGGESTPTTSSGGGSVTTSASCGYWQYTLYDTSALSFSNAHDHGGSTGSAGSHYHSGTTSYTIPTITADHYHDYRYMNSGGSHSHAVYDESSHTHALLADHKHGIEIPSHQHSVYIQPHSHGLIFGIYTSTSATGVTVKINGTDRTAALGGPFNVDQNNLNIASYLTIGQWNTIELGSSQLGRIDATVFVQAMIGV